MIQYWKGLVQCSLIKLLTHKNRFNLTKPQRKKTLRIQLSENCFLERIPPSRYQTGNWGFERKLRDRKENRAGRRRGVNPWLSRASLTPGRTKRPISPFSPFLTFSSFQRDFFSVFFVLFCKKWEVGTTSLKRHTIGATTHSNSRLQETKGEMWAALSAPELKNHKLPRKIPSVQRRPAIFYAKNTSSDPGKCR